MTTTHEFVVGDTVQLKSGGPVMTVQKVPTNAKEESHYWCQWFAGKKLERGVFAPNTLVKVAVDGAV